MGEEIKHPGTELSEATLTGVSGGEEVDPQRAGTARAALCRNCHKADHLKSTCKHRDDLQRYIEKNGINSVLSYLKCPYRNG